jgi:hypothetical protein
MKVMVVSHICSLPEGISAAEEDNASHRYARALAGLDHGLGFHPIATAISSEELTKEEAEDRIAGEVPLAKLDPKLH